MPRRPLRIAKAVRRRHSRNVDCRRWRAQADVRPAGAPRDDGHRSPAAGRRVRSIEAAHGNGWVVHRRAENAGRAAADSFHRRAPPRAATTSRPTLVGDAGLLGFPIAYTTTTPGADGKPVIVMQMEVTEFEVTNLDAALFEIPEGMTAAANGRELAKAVSDANETKLAARAPRRARRRPRKRASFASACPSLPTRRRRTSIRGRCARSSSPSWLNRKWKACRSPLRLRTS